MKIIILILFVNIFVFAQTNKDSNVEKKPVENIKANSSDTINEKNVYKLLYEATKQSNDRLVNSVYWSLGVVITLALFLIGYNILYNFKINRDQIEGINKENNNKIEQAKNESNSLFDSKINKSKNDFEQKLEEKVNQLNIDSDNRMKSVIETYEKQTNTYKESNELQVKTLEKSIDERANNINQTITILRNEHSSRINDIDARINLLDNNVNVELKHDLAIFKSELYYSEARVWELNKVPANVLNSYVDALDVELDVNWESKITLRNILTVIKDVNNILKNRKERMIVLLEKVKENIDIKNEILEKLEKLKVYD